MTESNNPKKPEREFVPTYQLQVGLYEYKTVVEFSDYEQAMAEIERLKKILAQEASENDELGAEYTLVTIQREELTRLRQENESLKDRVDTLHTDKEYLALHKIAESYRAKLQKLADHCGTIWCSVCDDAPIHCELGEARQTLGSDCVCAEINARHCSIHQEEK